MKRVILSTAIPVLAVCFVLCALNSANALSPTSPVTANASPSPSVTYTLTATLLGHVEIEPGGFYAVAGKKVLLGGLPYIAIVSNCNNPWQCQITTTAVSTDVPRVYGGIDVGGGKLYERTWGTVISVTESGTITVLYQPPEQWRSGWSRCEGDGTYAYCWKSVGSTLGVLSFDTNTPTVVYSITTSYVWTARDLLVASLNSKWVSGSWEYTVCVSDLRSGLQTCNYIGQYPTGEKEGLAIFPHLNTLYVQIGSHLYTYSVPTLTLQLEEEITLPLGSYIQAYGRDWLLVGAGSYDPDVSRLYVYRPQRLQKAVFQKEFLVPLYLYVQGYNDSLAIIGLAWEVGFVDFTRPEPQFYLYSYRKYGGLGTRTFRFGDRLIFAYPYYLSAYSLTNMAESGRYLLTPTEIYTPVTDYDHRLLMMGSRYYYLFDFSSYPPEVVSGTVSPEVASCWWKAIRGNYAYGTCSPRRGWPRDLSTSLDENVVYGYPATLDLSSMQIASTMNSRMFGPFVTNDKIYAFVTQTVGTGIVITVSVLSNDPNNLFVSRVLPNSVSLPNWGWMQSGRYEHSLFVQMIDIDNYGWRPYLVKLDLGVPQVITTTWFYNDQLAGADDLYVYLHNLTGQHHGFSHDFTRHYIFDLPPAFGTLLVAPRLLIVQFSGCWIYARPEISFPYKAYLPLVIRSGGN
jgi:hypothetical protein